ncbi:T9SS type A sorting domain-containing protein [Aureisphaera galaxeae]|uniref:T9SS-dependent choice-of-anchor J family protein n=1 Tax=Aureisphaera galaxeae TaxID=1538023 RepID=UPI002350A7B4|nr:T9SS type A sorting domain-containing protein [Aureisphaera galaxeae]MDC8003181.1 T9SS type A sorting domain-containing protein [Aureisphaera galaxeae]
MKKITLLVAVFAAFTMNAQIFSDDFNGETPDATTFANWTSVDFDNDGEFFEVSDISTSDASASPLDGMVADSDSWEDGNPNSPMTPDNFLILTNPVDLTGVSDGMLTFTFGTYQINGTFLEDRLAVYVSTSNDPATLITETPVFDDQIGNQTPADNGGENSAVDITLDLSSYAGMQVYIAFRHFDTFDHNSVLIDNVVVDGTLGLNDSAISTLSHYVSNNEMALRAAFPLQNVEIFNVLGQNVLSQKLSSNDETINIASLNAGMYIVKASVEGQTSSFKIVKR